MAESILSVAPSRSLPAEQARPLPAAYPLVMVVSRSAFILLAQGLVAALFWLRGSPDPWMAAAPWWTVYGTLADLGCLALLLAFTRKEGVSLLSLANLDRRRVARDLLQGAGWFVIIFPVTVIGATILSSLLVYGVMDPNRLFAGVISQRALPLWAVFYSRALWWPLWSVVEELTYNGYGLPRLEKAFHGTGKAVAFIAFWFTLQHCLFPLIPSAQYVVWKFLAFLPVALAMVLVFARTRRLLPLIVTHWTMDFLGAVMSTLR